MSFVPPKETVKSGEVAAPHALNLETAVCVAQMNGGIDRENVPANQVTKAKVPIDEMQTAWYKQATTVGGVRQTLVQDSTSGLGFAPIPDDSGLPFEEVIPVPAAGDLHIISSGGYQIATGTAFPGRLAFAVLVDGIVYALEDDNRRMNIGCWERDVRVPVAAGEHIVQHMFLFTAISPLAYVETIDWHQCQSFIHWMPR